MRGHSLNHSPKRGQGPYDDSPTQGVCNDCETDSSSKQKLERSSFCSFSCEAS